MDCSPGPGAAEVSGAEVSGAAEVRRALDLGYRSLAVRERTEAELRAFLERRRVAPEAVGAALCEIREAGYLDDAGYARRFAEDRRSLDRWGRQRIERDLARRGIAPELIEAALDGGDAEHDELGSALAILKERFGGGLPDDRERDRAWRALVRKGYSPDLAYEAVRRHERHEH